MQCPETERYMEIEIYYSSHLIFERKDVLSEKKKLKIKKKKKK